MASDLEWSSGRVNDACLAHLASGRKQAAIETLHLAQVDFYLLINTCIALWKTTFLGERTRSTTSSSTGQGLHGGNF